MKQVLERRNIKQQFKSVEDSVEQEWANCGPRAATKFCAAREGSKQLKNLLISFCL